MTAPMNPYRRIPLFLSSEHPCGYLPDRLARNATVDPQLPMSPALYAQLMAQGFRRSGDHVYRPHCASCQRCVPSRVDVPHFRAQRSQRRCWKHNADLTWQIRHELQDDHYALFQRYLQARHAGEGMDSDDRESFHRFLECGWGTAEFWEFRLEQRLLSVAVVDVLPQALSAVYTFFDPTETQRSLGVYAVLMQIEQARLRGLPHVYLGYWVQDSRKMDYKRQYRPLQRFDGRTWTHNDPGCPAPSEH